MIAEAFRKSAEHQTLWVTMEYLSGVDDAGPVVKGAHDREVTKRAVDRRRTILEHRAADQFRAYFREEQAHVINAIERGLGPDHAITAMGHDLDDVYRAVWRASAESWGAWAAEHVRRSAIRKYSPDEPRDEQGQWTDGGGAALINWKTQKATVQAGEYKESNTEVTQHISEDGRFTITPTGTMVNRREHGFRGRLSYRWSWTGYRLKDNKPGLERWERTHEKRYKTIADAKLAVKHVLRREGGSITKADAYDFGAPVDTWLRQNAGKRITGITEASRTKIAAQIAEGTAAGETVRQIARRVDKFYLEDIIPNRSMVIARTEVGSAANWAQNYIAERTAEAGVPMEKEWMSLRDDRTRDDHREADGQRVALDEPFEVGDDLLMYPGDESLGAGADEVVNCRCSTLHHVVDEEQAAKRGPKALSPYEFAKVAAGLESPDVITALAFARGVYGPGDDWVSARASLMKRVRHLRRATLAG